MEKILKVCVTENIHNIKTIHNIATLNKRLDGLLCLNYR